MLDITKTSEETMFRYYSELRYLVLKERVTSSEIIHGHNQIADDAFLQDELKKEPEVCSYLAFKINPKHFCNKKWKGHISFKTISTTAKLVGFQFFLQLLLTLQAPR